MTPSPDPAPPMRDAFDQAYRDGTAPWMIGEPQQAIVGLERDGWIRGAVLDAGCGAGEHTIHLARLGYDVLGIDYAESAVAHARKNAAARGVTARFAVADAMALDEQAYDTIVDSALFHIFGDDADRARYVRSLHRGCRPGGFVHVLALAETETAFGPQVGESTIRSAFGEGWALDDLTSSRYRGIVSNPDHAAAFDRKIGDHVDLPAWLARVRRI